MNGKTKEDEHQRIWKKNGIPPLAFCSINRAAELLECHEEDIFHWINTGKIYPSIFIESSLEVYVSVTANDDSTLSDEVINHVYSMVNRPSKIYIHECTGIGKPDLNDITDPESKRFLEHLPRGKNRFELKGYIFGLWQPFFHKSWFKGGEQELTQQNSIFPIGYTPLPGMLISFSVVDNLSVQYSNIMLERRDIERLYKSACDGVEIDDLPIRETLPITEPSTTVNTNKVGEFLEMLIRCVPELGDDVMNATANKRHSILSAFLEKQQKEGKFNNMKMPSSPTIEKYFKI